MGTGWSQEEASHSHPRENQLGTQNTQEAKLIGEIRGEKGLEDDVRTSQESGKSKDRVKVEVKLPHHLEAILKEADTPIDRSSVDKLFDQLYQGVLLNQRREKYWVEKKSNSNCFILFARDLLITWADNNRFWQWPCISETSEEAVEVAELINVCWLEVHSRFDTKKLTPGILYEVIFIAMLKDPAYGWDIPVNLRLKFTDGTKQEHKENLMMKPRGRWMEIPVGEFKATQENVGEMESSMYEYEGGNWKRGLVIKGLAIRPKN